MKLKRVVRKRCTESELISTFSRCFLNRPMRMHCRGFNCFCALKHERADFKARYCACKQLSFFRLIIAQMRTFNGLFL